MLLIAFGLYVMTKNVMIGFFVMSIGFVWILIWYLINKARQEKRILTLAMNSNERLLFRFNDKSFLHKTVTVLRAILLNGGIGNKNVVINIRDNKISGDFQALNNAKM